MNNILTVKSSSDPLLDEVYMQTTTIINHMAVFARTSTNLLFFCGGSVCIIMLHTKQPINRVKKHTCMSESQSFSSSVTTGVLDLQLFPGEKRNSDYLH